ncbi:MAG: hypothetical protein ACP5UA_00890 [Candidatus Hydrogenedens sp.]
MQAEVILHCNEINRCNQRGGRMFSIFDLLERETLNIELASFALYRISQGASFLVGANPGGAGKTTIMGALLNFVPIDVQLVSASEQEIKQGIKQGITNKKKCYICHEIGAGHWFAYLWGSALQNYFVLLDYGHILATNLHADDIDEAYDQICIQNRVPDGYFRRINLMFYIRVLSGYRRRIDKVYFSQGNIAHELIYDAKKQVNLINNYIENPDYFKKCQDFLCAHNGKLHTIEETRQELLPFLSIETPKF